MASTALLTSTAPALPAFADDGDKVLKSISKEGGELEAPVPESDHSFTGMMKFYVPLQEADGTVLGDVEYLNVDGTVEDTRTLGKPLVDAFHKGPVAAVDGVGFIGHGKRDAYAAVSLDDGLTWKNTNLSESADKSSSDVIRTDIPLFADTEGAYPGDVTNVFHALAGNKVLVAWPSRFCEGGEPSFSLDSNEDNQARRAEIAAYLGIDLATASADDLYLLDMYGVSGNQGSVDYIDDKFEQNQAVGEVPFSCLWTARGELVQGDDPRTEAEDATYMRWFNTERLTSGARDVNRIETLGVAGAGFVITWQEDPEGLRGGQGEGPGEGWSGAVANSQTDVWYSYLDFENFSVVQDPADDTGQTPMDLLDYEAVAVDTDVTQKPKPFVPFAMPMRLTDNAKCNVTNPQPYCYGEALEGSVDVPVDAEEIPLDPREFGLADKCFATVDVPTGQNNTPTPVCVTEDGLPLVGNTASTRPRVNLFGYETDGDLTGAAEAEYDSAFVIVQLEEDKGVGRFGFTEEGAPCDPEGEDEGCIAFDEGKNQWYHSFSMSLDDPMVSDEDGLLANLADHGNMLNQPEVDWTTGELSPVRSTEDMWGFGDYDYEIRNSEIARRASLLGQDVYKADASTEGLLLLPAWKQGIMNQGGPADVMSRRIVLPEDWTVADGNPYAFRNMECTDWGYEDGSNPYYPDGLCLDSAINLSGGIPDTAVDSETGSAVTPPQVDFSQGTTFGIGDTNPILQGQEVEPNTTKVLTWHQCPATFTHVDGDVETVTCDTDDRTDDSTLADQSWYNPLDVAKGHRGYLDGDFAMMLYAWSPNWRLNAKGSDRYELYVRRSFTGGTTWGTQPASGTHWDGTAYAGDGTVTCEIYRDDATEASGELDEPRVCNEYPAGAPEQARNVTQHKSMRITTLDPRYAMTGAPQGVGITADPFGYGIPEYTSGEGGSEDVRDPSRYFIVYETGDNTTTAEGEPEPLDLYHGRATDFGDEYQVWAESVDECYPSVPHEQEVDEVVEGSGFCNEFDQLEQGIPGLEASEASLTSNPGGEFLYATWAQALHELVPSVGATSEASSPAESTEPTWDVTYTVDSFEDEEAQLAESDAMSRRVWWIDGYVSDTFGWDFGQGAGVNERLIAGKATTETAESLAAALEAEGIASVELWADTPDADDEFVKVDEDVEVDRVFEYTATEGAGSYRFYTIAVSDDGTREEAPEGADTETLYLAEGADVTAPVSEASARRVSNGKPFMVRYKAEDELGGSGLAAVDLYVRVPGATEYTLVDTDAGSGINRKFLYTPDAGDGRYLFYTVATDQAGNIEAAPAKADARVRVDATPPRATGPKVKPRPFDISRDRVMRIKSRVSERGKVTVLIKRYGRVVKKLGPTAAPAGIFVERWGGRNRAGGPVRNGRYAVVLHVEDRAGNSTWIRTTVRVRR